MTPRETIEAHDLARLRPPFFEAKWGRAGQRVELTLEGLGPDDIERLDNVAVG